MILPAVSGQPKVKESAPDDRDDDDDGDDDDYDVDNDDHDHLDHDDRDDNILVVSPAVSGQPKVKESALDDGEDDGDLKLPESPKVEKGEAP